MRKRAATAAQGEVVVVPPSPAEVIDLDQSVEGVIVLDPGSGVNPITKLHIAIRKAQELASDRVREAAIDFVLKADYDDSNYPALANAVDNYLAVDSIHRAYAEHSAVDDVHARKN
jgi:hypothetical protein